MQERIIAFIKALRAAGVRVSLAESIDSFRALEALGITDRQLFHDALQATLVKDSRWHKPFEELFPLFFGTGDAPMLSDAAGLADLDPEDQQRLRQEIAQLREKLRELLERLRQGRDLSPEELQQLAQQSGINAMASLNQRRWVERRMEQQLGLNELKEGLKELLERLEAAGLSDEALDMIAAHLKGNGQALRDQIAQFVGSGIAERLSDEYDPQQGPQDLEHMPLSRLSASEAERLRAEVRRMAAQLRSRAALRQRRAATGQVDIRRTMRNNLRYGGVPMELARRKRHQRPKLVVICDISTSMRPVAEFMLTMIYELQDQVSKTRSFAFIDTLHDISDQLAAGPGTVSVDEVLSALPPGYYNTDLGASLDVLLHRYLDALDWRTTVIVVGDGRNNFNDPRLEALRTIRRHAKRLIWFTPEQQWQWGTGDSDMLLYAPLCDRVHHVSTLAELAAAVDRLLSN